MANAADVRLAPGEWPIREGEPPYFCSVRGPAADGEGCSWPPGECSSTNYPVGDFFGETPILLGTQALVHCGGNTLPRRPFRPAAIPGSDPRFKRTSAMILQTMNDRLMRVQKYAATVPSSRVLILGTKYDTDCRDIRGSFLESNPL